MPPNESLMREDGSELSQAPPPRKPLPGLYLVATPIGNARDITLRALDVLGAADFIACEDTRETGKLLSMYGIRRKLFRYDEHVADEVTPRLLARLAEGAVGALVSDAGTPLISDPGYGLVGGALAAGIPVTTCPGASALLPALGLSGLAPDRFFFAGFLPPRSSARRAAIAELAAVPATLIFYEAPQRLVACLSDLAEILGDRKAAVARELTKKFEEIRRGGLVEFAAHYESEGPPKGEIVLVIDRAPAAHTADDETLDRLLRDAMARQSLAAAVREVTDATGLRRSRVYARALELKDD